MIKIKFSDCSKVIEPLNSPFGFKGSYSSSIWITTVKLKTFKNFSSGSSIQGVLWSDGNVYSKIGESKSNELMFSITQHLCELLVDKEYEKPGDLFDFLYTQGMKYAKDILQFSPRKTFILNAMVPIDNALRLLYCKEMQAFNYSSFAFDNEVFQVKQDKLALIPLISYNTSIEQIKQLADDGVCVFKIKIGADPDRDNDKNKMLEQDKKRIAEIHSVLTDYKSEYTDNGYVAYYLDANGRYDTIDRVIRLLEYTKLIGAFDRIILLEEPFDEENDLNVSNIEVTVAADESVHDVYDAKKKIDLGYKAFALKPIAKTITATNKIAKLAIENNIALFCADLTVTPLLVEINKNYASRLLPVPGMKIGIIESNGSQNYVNWAEMMAMHPLKNHLSVTPVNGIFQLNDDYHKKSGGIFL